MEKPVVFFASEQDQSWDKFGHLLPESTLHEIAGFAPPNPSLIADIPCWALTSNDAFTTKTVHSLSEVVSLGQSTIHSALHGQHAEQVMVRWSFPAEGWLKCNTQMVLVSQNGDMQRAQDRVQRCHGEFTQLWKLQQQRTSQGFGLNWTRSVQLAWRLRGVLHTTLAPTWCDLSGC